MIGVLLNKTWGGNEKKCNFKKFKNNCLYDSKPIPFNISTTFLGMINDFHNEKIVYILASLKYGLLPLFLEQLNIKLALARPAYDIYRLK